MAALATTTMVSAAQAGSMSLDTRIDHSSVDVNDAAVTKAAASHADYSKLYFRVARLDFQGALNQETTTTYRVRFNLLGAATAPTATIRDGASNQLQIGYVAHKMGDLTLTMGKFVSEIGGFEGISNGSDMYLQSEYYAGTFNGVSTNTNLLYSAAWLHVSGARLEYALAPTQSLALSVLNPLADHKNASSAFAESAMGYGVVYKGSFMDKALAVMGSYHVNPGLAASGGDSTDNKNTFMTVGLKYTMNPVVVQLDYNTQEAKYAAGKSSDKITSIVGKVAYTGIEQWTPRIEFHQSQIDAQAGTSDKYTGMGLVAEYKPRNENNFRYHVAYNTVTGSGDTSYKASGDVTRTEIIVGTRLMADFLK